MQTHTDAFTQQQEGAGGEGGGLRIDGGGGWWRRLEGTEDERGRGKAGVALGGFSRLITQSVHRT